MSSEAPSLANFDATALSPESAAQAKAEFIKAGFDPAEVDARFSASGQAPNAQQQTQQPVSSDPYPSLSRAQMVNGYKALLKHASDPDAVRASAARDGISAGELDITPAATHPAMTVEEANAQLQANDPPELVAGSSPNDYKLTFDRETIEGLDPRELVVLNSEYTEALHAAEIPLRLAQPLVTASIESANRFEDLSDTELKLAFAHEGQRVRRAVDNIEQTVADHNLAFSRLPDHFKEMASTHYLFHSADAFVALAHAGQAIREREARRAKR